MVTIASAVNRARQRDDFAYFTTSLILYILYRCLYANESIGVKWQVGVNHWTPWGVTLVVPYSSLGCQLLDTLKNVWAAHFAGVLEGFVASALDVKKSAFFKERDRSADAAFAKASTAVEDLAGTGFLPRGEFIVADVFPVFLVADGAAEDIAPGVKLGGGEDWHPEVDE